MESKVSQHNIENIQDTMQAYLTHENQENVTISQRKTESMMLILRWPRCWNRQTNNSEAEIRILHAHKVKATHSNGKIEVVSREIKTIKKECNGNLRNENDNICIEWIS